ncbi:hypothetical protein GF323_03275 [Candidatus Woesearchaeota archaeon]|nr:hypothetical protein [Candidatus Woesearchaeota archaeon]
MYNQCESCKKQIFRAADCRLYSNDGITIHTYCVGCYEQRKEDQPKSKVL